MRQFVPDDASRLAAVRNILRARSSCTGPSRPLPWILDIRAPGARAAWPPDHRRRARRCPRRCRWVSCEDAPGNVASCHTSGPIETARGQGLGTDARPGPRVVKADRDPRGGVDLCRTRGGVVHPYPDPDPARARPQHPKRRMIAPARPLPLTPLASATEASALDLLPPGKMAGARTSTAGSQNLRASASRSWLCTSGRAPLPARRVGLLGMALHIRQGSLTVAGRVGLPGAGELRRVQVSGLGNAATKPQIAGSRSPAGRR